MARQISFPYPFTGFNSLTFTNCFASVCMHLEKVVGVDQYDCPKREGKKCNGCGNCNGSTAKMQENYYLVMDTMSGRSSVRLGFEGTPDHTDNSFETIEFLMGYAGYEYRTVQDDLVTAVQASIDCERPVLARVKDESNGAFRVLIGYDGDTLTMANPANAQRKPTTPTYAEIAEVIVVTGKSKPRHTLADGLRRIRSVMARNRDAQVWDQYMKQFRYWDEGLQKADFEEIKRRFGRICGISWYNFNCHNFAETFRYWSDFNRSNNGEMFRRHLWVPLKDARLDEVCRQIDQSYDSAHTRNWQIIALNECRDWSKRRGDSVEWGYCTCVVQCLEELKKYDSEVLAAIESAIAVCEAGHA